jgi:hypothetical protein
MIAQGANAWGRTLPTQLLLALICIIIFLYLFKIVKQIKEIGWKEREIE